jgi:hypothetical protein
MQLPFHAASIANSWDPKPYPLLKINNSPPNPTNTHPTPLQSLYILHVLPLFARRDRPPQRRVNVCSDQPISCSLFTRSPALSQICDEAFSQANGDVKALTFVGGLESFGQVAGAGRDGYQVGVEGEVCLGEVKRGGEMFCS